jgi:thiol-disulfide isomerase/thioredoxin
VVVVVEEVLVLQNLLAQEDVQLMTYVIPVAFAKKLNAAIFINYCSFKKLIFFMKKVFSIYFIFLTLNLFCQNNSISIKINQKYNVFDSLQIFKEDNINNRCYKKNKLSILIKTNQFKITDSFEYPQMYRIRFKSEYGILAYRKGFFFFDENIKSIVIDTNSNKSNANGKTGKEYENIFKPFFFGKFNKFMTIDEIISNDNVAFIEHLSEYVKTNQNSYVALWFLILDFSNNGHNFFKEQILNSFSTEIKSEKLWKIVNEEFQNVKIKENQKFPNLLLQNTDLQPETVTIPNSKYTLVDFWFSRCRPCLEEMPKWINLYNLYKDKGFNVIGISSDKTENVKPYWQVRIVERGIPWKNYLDENAVFCISEKINRFPTNFLLNEKGEVIQKNIEPEDLEKILISELK